MRAVDASDFDLDVDRLLGLDRLLASDYLDGLQDMPVVEVRDRRDEYAEVEDALSVLRRMVQGRLDIVHADLHRRSVGLESGDLGRVVEQLPEILSEGGRSAQVRGRLRKNMAPDVNFRRLTADLDRLIDVDTSAGLLGMSDSQVRQIADALEDLERKVSSRRRAIQARVDECQAEVVRRYKSGDASVDALLS